MKFIFAFLLLATLSMVVNAIPHQLLKRTTTFSPCLPSKPGEQPPPLLNVILSPDPIVAGKTDSVTISGTLSRPVIDGDFTVVALVGLASKVPIGDPVAAPTDPKTPFSQVLDLNVAAKLPATYVILAGVGNPKTQEVLGCALCIIGIGVAESVDLGSYPLF
nr:14820_t:CDS:1 [Entrophospora candida]